MFGALLHVQLPPIFQTLDYTALRSGHRQVLVCFSS
jgi:hypothetical protein